VTVCERALHPGHCALPAGYSFSIDSHPIMFFLEVNGIAQTGMMTRKAAIAAAERGHAERPDAIVVLMKFNPITNRDIEVKRLY
jgi:hypothetical protein